ncbi:Dynein heavy chain 12 [Durusdinium trenchii]|uniref:Axonemal n=1 Tax=Durusdinium trenchii TaxID=1381693 RepID=A0ABP0S432_9DINO
MSICHEVDATPSWQLVLSALLLILLPEALAFGLFSSMGFAANIASFAADSQVDLLGNVAAVACALALAAAFIVDVHRRNLAVQALFAFLLAGGFLATSSLKYIGYPWLSSLVCFAFAIILVAGLRLRCFKGGDDGIPGQRFFDSVAVSFVLATLVAFACWVGWQAMFDRFWSLETRKWLASQNEEVYEYFYDNSSMALNYTAHCSEEKDVSFLDTDAQAAVLSACKSAETVWFLQWAGPCAIGIGNVIVALVSWVFAQAAQGLEYDEAEAQRVKSALKKSTALIVMMLTVMYSAQYVSGANVTISSGLVALGAASVASIVGFMLLEFGFQRLNSVTQKDRLAQNLMKILKSDWMKAVMVFGLNLFIPVMLLLDAVRQKVRKCTGLPTEDGKFTKEGQRIIDEMHTWAWSSIFFKVNLLGMMGVALLLGMKVTYVFFAWLNQTLAAANLTFIVLSLMVLGVGLAMFLCPIVPGSAVYLFAGVVLGAQSQVAGPDGVIGFGWGIVAGALVSSVAKMIACTLQYSMGYGMGKFVKVQQFVGVDKVPTRAMEQILKQRGMKMDKVSILVAGPDWPTSVLCGILRLNIPRMLLGTLPVIGVSIVPQVLVGALLTYSDESSSGVMSIVSSGVTLAAAVVQALAMFYFTYRIMKVVDEDGEKLAEPRQEHAAVAALTEKEKDYVAALLQKSQWGEMKRFQRVLVLLSSMCMLTSSFVFIADYSVADKFCFRSFEITGQIDLPIDQGGLAGDVMNLVIIPWGWCALGLALAGVIFHIVVNKWLACDARAHLMRDHPNEDRPQNGPRSSTVGKPSGYLRQTDSE